MRTKRFFTLILIIVFFALLFQTSHAQKKEYLPGDFVHVIVDAPIDTAQITATMPDETIISLIQERRSTIWRGIWQVPINFRKGTYFAKLSAIDVAGNIFEGQSDVFHVGELTMITLVGKSTKEVEPKVPLRERITVEAVFPGIGREELIKEIRKLIAQPIEGPLPELKVSEKTELIKRNFKSGKDYLNQGKFSEAASYFRIVLYLTPEHKEAGSYLVETQLKIKEKETRQKQARMALFTIIALALLILALVAIFIVRIFPRKRTEQKPSLRMWGWASNPFTADIFSQLGITNERLESEGLKNFIKARIQSVGGEGVSPFTDSAIDEIYSLSKGRPKAALSICEAAVRQAAAQNEEKITAEIVREYKKNAPANILIADDEEIIRTNLEAILKKAGGYNTDSASDGEEALRKIKEKDFDVVLLDIEMPKLNGYEVLKQARALFHDLPIIFITGWGQPQKVVESMSKDNLTAYIEKPFTAEKVLDAVARSLKIE